MVSSASARKNSGQRIILASTSPFRRDLLSRLGIPFTVASPGVDETLLPGEKPQDAAIRLSIAKAYAIAKLAPDALIVGSDQVASAEDRHYGKPGDRAGAVSQLAEMSGNSIVFYTAVAVLNAATGALQSTCVPTEVRFRRLSADEIERYVDADQPFDCAGSAKSESLGIALLDHLRGDDPTALIGLPLIAVCRMLREEGLAIP